MKQGISPERGITMKKEFKYYYTNDLFDDAAFSNLLKKYGVPAFPLTKEKGLVFWVEPLKELAKHPADLPQWIYMNLKWML